MYIASNYATGPILGKYPLNRLKPAESSLSVALSKLQSLARWAEVPNGYYDGVSRKTLDQARTFLFLTAGYSEYLHAVEDVAVSGIRISYRHADKTLHFYIHESGPEFVSSDLELVEKFDLRNLSACFAWLNLPA